VERDAKIVEIQNEISRVYATIGNTPNAPAPQRGPIMSLRSIRRVIVIAVLLAGFASAASADSGIKFGPTFANFSSDALDFNNRVGWYGGIFFGGNRDGGVGLQGELNWIRKQTEFGIEGQKLRIDYLQIPALLRLTAGTDSPSGFSLYGIVGPAIDLKIGDEVEGITIDDGFEGADVSLIFGGGIEVARIIIEGRYQKGFRQINKSFIDFTEIKTQSFMILFGVRFN
jgi:hypothetical protein